MLLSNSVIANSNIQFGTSGARGLATDFSNNVCAAFTVAFVASLENKTPIKQVALAIDNRPSSPDMARACAAALLQQGIEPVYYGVVPTPALAYVAMQQGVPAIMITGSHIPFDRNGLKFYRPDGEITKADEKAILEADVAFSSVDELPVLSVNETAAKQYIERYTSLFSDSVLQGKRVGIYEHSSAGRDLYRAIFEACGAEVVALGRSDEFVPIDTEAVSDEDKAKAVEWSKSYHLDFIFSTDGDGDRPLLADEQGTWLRGDTLCALCAQDLGIEAIAMPVSCNTMIDGLAGFTHVARTKIGSPYVIEAINALNQSGAAVAGFEANGGFLLGSDMQINGQTLKALPTRDAVLPAIMVMASTVGQLENRVAALPTRYTASDRLKEVDKSISQVLIKEGIESPQSLLAKLDIASSAVAHVDTTDGLRLTLSNDDIVHLRPSGNAPELRCYAESDSADKAQMLVTTVLEAIYRSLLVS
ncbi:phosphomannomutase [Salinivibrio proteolyticus]|uniref:Phosphomannomutase n=1 Tax=Salinivibrio proteolyticus TaxID=334715 RepID=A0ABY7LBF0_9GAMM|nr:phosphomannomutase [Salinivibrio proteolyticus]WBA13947.1 phosphomannomutase [Salinivibrio proteolyticus]